MESLTNIQLLYAAADAIKPPASIFKIGSKLTYRGTNCLTVDLVDTFKLDIDPSNPWADRVTKLSNNWRFVEGHVVINTDAIISTAVRAAARDLQALVLHSLGKTHRHPNRCNAFRRINATLDAPTRNDLHTKQICNWWCRLGMKADMKTAAEAPGAAEVLSAMLDHADWIKRNGRS
jgi:hypothetical protein